MKLAKQIDKLAKTLDRELDNFSQGQKFYSVREISDKFGANRRVVDGALDQMANDGLIRREERIGIFSCTDRKPLSRKLLFAAPDFPSENTSNWCKLICEAAQARPGFQVKKHFFDPEEPFISRLPLDGVDVLISLRPAKPFSEDDVDRLAQLDIPIVLLGTLLEDMPFSTANNNNVQGAMLACQYLIENGYDRILIVVSESEIADVPLRREVFEQYARFNGASAWALRCGTRNSESANQRSYECLKQYLTERGCDFNAIWVVSDSSAPGVYTALNEHGIRVPEDVGVLGFDGNECASFYHPPLTSVGGDYVGIVADIFKKLEDYFAGGVKIFQLMRPMRIIERSSIDKNRKFTRSGKENEK